MLRFLFLFTYSNRKCRSTRGVGENERNEENEAQETKARVTNASIALEGAIQEATFIDRVDKA